MLGLARRSLTGPQGLSGLGLVSSVPAWTPPITKGLLLNIPRRLNANAIWNNGAPGVLAPSVASVDAVGTFDHARTRLITGAQTGVLRVERNGGLSEEAVTNEIIRSDDISHPDFTKDASSVVADQAIAPDGTMSADELLDDNSSNAHIIYDGATALPGVNTDCVLSCWFKANTLDHAILRIHGTGFNAAPVVTFNLITGAATNIGGEPYRAAYAVTRPEWNGWWLCVMKVNSDSSGTGCTPNVGPHDGSGALAYAGDGTGSIYAWGLQIEYVAKFETSYTPTSGAAVTRAADRLEHASAGNILTSAWTVFLCYTPSFNAADITGSWILLDIRDAANTNGLSIFHGPAGGGKLRFLVRSSSTNAVLKDELSTSAVRRTPQIVTVTGKANEFKFYIDAVLQAQQLSGLAPSSFGPFQFGHLNGGNHWWGSSCHLLAYDRVLTAKQITKTVSAIRSWMGIR